MITDPHEEKNISIQGKETPVWFYGDSKNPPIIFIHGRLRGFSEYIGDLPPRYLSKNYCVSAFDLPGFGKSKEIKMSPVEFLDRIVNKFFKGKRVVLFGTSYGGIVAINYALGHREKVKALIIAATPVIYGPFKPIFLVKYLPYFRKKFAYVNEFESLTEDKLKVIKITSLLFYSNEDRRAPLYMGKKLQEILPNSKLVVVKNRSHGWFLHRIDQTGILKEIESFL